MYLTPVTDDDELRVFGYGLTCQECHKEFFLNTGIGPKPDHHLARNNMGQLTILPPIRCPFHCGWCIRVIDGIAYHCRRKSDG